MDNLGLLVKFPVGLVAVGLTINYHRQLQDSLVKIQTMSQVVTISAVWTHVAVPNQMYSATA